MLDNGFPLATESNILKELIKPPTTLRTVVNTITGMEKENSTENYYNQDMTFIESLLNAFGNFKCPVSCTLKSFLVKQNPCLLYLRY